MYVKEIDWLARTKFRMRELGIKQIDIARALGITQAAVGHHFAGRNQPNLAQLETIAKMLNVNLAWLITGTGPMLIDDPSTTVPLSMEEEKWLKLLRQLTPEQVNAVRQVVETIVENFVSRDLGRNSP